MTSEQTDPATSGDGTEGGERLREIRLETEIRAAPSEVWDAWADPDRLAGWFVDRAEGEPVPGTSYLWFWDDFGMEVPVEVVEAVPGERLVLRTDMGAEASLLEITLRGEGGRTRLRLVQSGFDTPPGDPGIEGVRSGWTLALGLLRLYLERWPDRVRRELFLTREGSFGPADLAPLQRTAEGLERWLVADGAEDVEAGLPEPGDVEARAFGAGEVEAGTSETASVVLTLVDGTSLTGRVLAASDTEAVLSWDEIEGAVELKSYPAGPPEEGASGHDAGESRWTAALRVSTWSEEEGVLERVRPGLVAALDRLVGVLEG